MCFYHNVFFSLIFYHAVLYFILHSFTSFTVQQRAPSLKIILCTDALEFLGNISKVKLTHCGHHIASRTENFVVAAVIIS